MQYIPHVSYMEYCPFKQNFFFLMSYITTPKTFY
jgi:hypothetical protein